MSDRDAKGHLQSVSMPVNPYKPPETAPDKSVHDFEKPRDADQLTPLEAIAFVILWATLGVMLANWSSFIQVFPVLTALALLVAKVIRRTGRNRNHADETMPG
jgi:hypothetical protein